MVPKAAGIKIREAEARYVLEVQLAFGRLKAGNGVEQRKSKLRAEAEKAKRDWQERYGGDS